MTDATNTTATPEAVDVSLVGEFLRVSRGDLSTPSMIPGIVREQFFLEDTARLIRERDAEALVPGGFFVTSGVVEPKSSTTIHLKGNAEKIITALRDVFNATNPNYDLVLSENPPEGDTRKIALTTNFSLYHIVKEKKLPFRTEEFPKW